MHSIRTHHAALPALTLAILVGGALACPAAVGPITPSPATAPAQEWTGNARGWHTLLSKVCEAAKHLQPSSSALSPHQQLRFDPTPDATDRDPREVPWGAAISGHLWRYSSLPPPGAR